MLQHLGKFSSLRIYRNKSANIYLVAIYDDFEALEEDDTIEGLYL